MLPNEVPKCNEKPGHDPVPTRQWRGVVGRSLVFRLLHRPAPGTQCAFFSRAAFPGGLTAQGQRKGERMRLTKVLRPVFGATLLVLMGLLTVEVFSGEAAAPSGGAAEAGSPPLPRACPLLPSLVAFLR